MTTADEDKTEEKTSAPAAPQATKEPGPYASASPHPRAAAVLTKLQRLEQRAVHLPVIGKFHGPDNHDIVYVAGVAALLAIGIVELPIALAAVGGHVLIKQHHSRSLSTIGEVVEDVLGHHV